jgi:ERCC4-type nuclease
VTIIQDTREQAGKHEHVIVGLKSLGVNVVRSKLFVGDYTRIDNMSVCIDTKQSLSEVYNNVIQDHERFKRELLAAKDAGIRLVVLVEESGIHTVQDVEKWNNPRIRRYSRMTQRMQQAQKPPVPSERLSRIMQTMADKYGVEWMFCDKRDTAKRICEILGIDAKFEQKGGE